MAGNGTSSTFIRSAGISQNHGQRFMRVSLAGRALLALGLAVGVAATVAWVAGYDPSTLPPALLRIAAYKLAALTVLALMTAGAVVLRFGQREDRRQLQSASESEKLSLNAGDVDTIENAPLRRRADRDQSREHNM